MLSQTSFRNASASMPRKPVLLLLFLLVGVHFSCARRESSSTVRGPVRSTIVLAHEYDPVADAVVSWSIKAGQSIGQSFVVPEGCSTLKAFRVKLVRRGSATPLFYRIGSSWGGDDVISGEIQPDKVGRFFERWTGKDFPESVAVKPRQRYYLQLQALQGSGDGGYELFGTASAQVDHPDFNRRYQYLPQWGEGSIEPRAFENPINLDYGSQTPRYEGGTAISPNGDELPTVDFAFQLSSDDARSRPSGQEEERFAFVEDQLLAPMHAATIRKEGTGGKEGDEVEMTGEWKIVSAINAGLVAKTAIADFRKFMEISLGTPLSSDAQPRIDSSLTSNKVIVAGTRAELADLGGELNRSESFTLQVTPERIILCGFDERGLMRGLYHLEDMMSFRRAPILKVQTETRAPLHSPRITSAAFYSTLDLEISPDPYTDELLSKISHYGFDSIWVWADLFKIGRSEIYPELDQQVDLHQQRLQRIIERARKYGVDVYLVLAYHPLPDSFFARHPDTRGTPFKAYGGTNVLCTSSQPVRRYIEEATASIFQHSPDLRGLVFCVGGEGFIHCYTRSMNCPRCSQRSAQDVVAELASSVSKGAHAARSNADVVLWPYSASNHWSREDITQSKLIEKLPKEVTFMTEFGKEGRITFGYKSIPAYDYPISYLGPAERFTEQAGLSRQHGLPFWVKTEHAIALEAIQTPYIPVFPRWAERFRRINAFDNVSGVFANWMHYGFTPSIAAEIANWHMWSPLPDTEKLLRAIARREFGPGTEEPAMRAWNQWSDAIVHYPFSGSMAMGPVQKGPAHPLFLNPDYKPLHNTGRQFKNNLSWTEPWGVTVVISEMEQLVDGWQKGVDAWDQVSAAAPPAYKGAAIREGGVSRALLACFRSALNVARFYKLRDEVLQEKSPARAMMLLDQLEKTAMEELENARAALPVLLADSRLGYANSAGASSTGVPRGGIYSPGSIEKKIKQVENLLKKEIPELQTRLKAGRS